MRLVYIDDSGATETRTVVFGWVELDVTAWRSALRMWLDWRHELHQQVGIPTDYELHGTQFLGGRGRPTGTDWDARKAARLPIIASALATISRLPGVTVGSVYACASNRKDHHNLKARTYSKLVRMIDDRWCASSELGMIMMDGDGTDPTYRAAHRELRLSTRSIIEDPMFHGSHHSQWVQMADLIAYTAYMHIARLPSKEPMWGWYRDYCGHAETGPEPHQIFPEKRS